MVKKGLSLEQKRERVLEFFHETDSVFQFKEVEKEAIKRGVTAQSVKDVVQSLVDDNLVNQEKIGISNYLWAFAGQASTKLKNEEIALTEKLAALTKQHAQLQAQLQQERSKQDDLDETQRLQKTLQELGQNKVALKAEQAELEVVDPDRFKAMKEACTTTRDSANRWLDNLYSLKQWCNKKFSGRETELDKFFEENGLTENVDYLD